MALMAFRGSAHYIQLNITAQVRNRHRARWNRYLIACRCLNVDGMTANGPHHPRDQINFNAVRSPDCLRELSARCRLRSAQLFGLLVDAHAARAVGDDVEEATRHHQILVEIYHVRLIADRQMHTKGGAEARQQPTVS